MAHVRALSTCGYSHGTTPIPRAMAQHPSRTMVVCVNMRKMLPRFLPLHAGRPARGGPGWRGTARTCALGGRSPCWMVGCPPNAAILTKQVDDGGPLETACGVLNGNLSHRFKVAGLARSTIYSTPVIAWSLSDL